LFNIALLVYSMNKVKEVLEGGELGGRRNAWFDDAAGHDVLQRQGHLVHLPKQKLTYNKDNI